MTALQEVIRLCSFANRVKQGQTTKNEERITNNQGGFSLIEILVTISIIALVGAVAIPNLNKFSRSQQLEATASEVVNVLKKAQASAQSRIQCPRGEASDTWTVRLFSDGYTLIAKCQSTGNELIFTKPYTPAGSSNTYGGSLNVCNNGTTDIIFYKNQVFYQCLGTTDTYIAVVYLTLRDLADPTNTEIVTIGRGGIIRVE